MIGKYTSDKASNRMVSNGDRSSGGSSLSRTSIGIGNCISKCISFSITICITQTGGITNTDHSGNIVWLIWIGQICSAKEFIQVYRAMNK